MFRLWKRTKNLDESAETSRAVSQFPPLCCEQVDPRSVPKTGTEIRTAQPPSRIVAVSTAIVTAEITRGGFSRRPLKQQKYILRTGRTANQGLSRRARGSGHVAPTVRSLRAFKLPSSGTSAGLFMLMLITGCCCCLCCHQRSVADLHHERCGVGCQEGQHGAWKAYGSR